MKWTKIDIKRAKILLSEGKNYQDIGLILQRTADSVRNKLTKLESKWSKYHFKDTACKTCGVIFNHQKNDNRIFCSKSCSATFNNQNVVRNSISKKNLCDICGAYGKNRKNQICKFCSSKAAIERYGLKLKGDFISKSGRHKYQSIRKHAHRIMQINQFVKTSCEICDYKNHVELCHIKSISSFSDECTLNEINAPTNLVYLCPNCHWEQEHGLLQLV